ncbi:MAG TPA: aminodeoxychorismate/anthranilate synthase component II [Elusimicrobiota bacterium]|nr:aminodeoxychorismate/anthranilate synthase component II [Elusimicrobiota bacterium]
MNKGFVLVIDNYDSFTYNLVQYLGELRRRVKVVRNDAMNPADIGSMRPSHILISPGPCTPKEAGISVRVIQQWGGKIPLFGVCLGLQSLGYAFGGQIIRAKKLMHGKTSRIRHDNKGLFAGVPTPFTATRYHSLVVEKRTLPPCFQISATSEDGEIMGLRHKRLPCLEGVQFHPESILTEHGRDLLVNFLKMTV